MRTLASKTIMFRDDGSTAFSFLDRRYCGPAQTLARAIPLPPPQPHRLNLINAHTKETFSGIYRDDNGPIPRVMDELSVFLRDFRSGDKIGIDVDLLDFLSRVMQAVGEKKATILSAYRTPETNAMLATKGLRSGRKQPASLRPRARHPFRRQAGRRDESGARDAVRRRRLVSALQLHAHRHRPGAQLGPRPEGSRRRCWSAAARCNSTRRAGCWSPRARAGRGKARAACCAAKARSASATASWSRPPPACRRAAVHLPS